MINKNLRLLETIKNTPQHPQVQYDLNRQLLELRVMANKLGLYDAADFIFKPGEEKPNGLISLVWIFFYEYDRDKILFKVRANTAYEAYNLAEEYLGPQVEDMMYTIEN